MTNIEEVCRAVQELTLEVQLMKKDLCWIKMILKWVIIGIAAVLGIQIPGWI